MSLDQTTESIAHFAGYFHLAIEETRLRKAYEEFKALKREEEDDDRNEFVPVRLEAPLDLGDYNPHSRYVPEPPGPRAPEPPLVPESGGYDEPAGLHGVQAPPMMPNIPPIGDSGGLIILPYVPIPSSAITITIQSIFLSDDDSYGDIEAVDFIPLEVLHAALDAAIALSHSLQAWSTDGLVAAVMDDPSVAVEFFEAVTSIVITGSSGIDAVLVSGEAVHGTIVDGQSVDDMPAFEDSLPAFLKLKREVHDDEAARDDTAMPGVAKDAPAFPWGEPLTGHSVVTGANELVNEVVIKTNWIDASVIAVAGDVVNLKAISQINIASDRDTINGKAKAGGAPTTATNIASLPEAKLSGLSSPGQATSLGLPEVWNVLRFDGDVTLANIVTQHTFATDTDRLDLTFTANATLITTGENLTFNLADITELGFNYDLIMVGGSMTTINAINQVNVLLDDDHMSGEGIGTAIISGDDNALRNEATILRETTDSYVAMAQEFADALREMAAGAADLAQEAAHSAHFQGYETLRALYIDGNLTQMNIVDQINYLGDQDQVHMARDAMQSAMEAHAVSLTTGSNLLANRTVVQEGGLDSQIMAAGGIYDDAILYQAELIDTDAHPLGVGMSALATEAVAFLTDDLAVPGGSDALDGAGHYDAGAAAGTTFDVMQTMTT